MAEQTYISAQEAETRIVALYRKEHGAFADTFNTAIDACQTVILDMYDNAPKDVIAVVRCGECKWWRKKDDSPYGYCYACKHGHYSEHWEIGIYRLYKADWFCADGEREVQE